ncbi:MAG: TetR/AcrR family transcriptional regulator [Gaiellaceae bacterium]
MTDRSIAPAQEQRRRQILAAAVKVFARKGYHTARVGDIAEEAGVAHGLLYHYFASKEALLETVFRETWSELLDAVHAVEGSGDPPREQLRQVAAILLRSWRRDPDLVRVLVREVARSPQLQERVDEVGEAFRAIERIIVAGQAGGAFRGDLDPRLASWIFYGGLEEILTGWVLGQLPDGDEAVALAESTIVEVVCAGLTQPGSTGRPGPKPG